MLAVPCDDTAAVTIYEWVHSRTQMAPGTFVISFGARRITTRLRPRRGMELRVSIHRSTKGALGRCMTIGSSNTDNKRRLRSDGDGDAGVPTPAAKLARRECEVYVRVLLDSGSDVHVCPSSFLIGASSVDLPLDGKPCVHDVQHAQIDCNGMRAIFLQASTGTFPIHMLVSDNVTHPVVSLVALVRNGVTWQQPWSPPSWDHLSKDVCP